MMGVVWIVMMVQIPTQTPVRIAVAPTARQYSTIPILFLRARLFIHALLFYLHSR